MFQVNPYAIPLFISLIPLGFILRAAWQKRDKAVSRMLFGFVGMSAGFVVSYAFELLFSDLTLIKWALRFEYLFHGALIFWLLFALAYSGDEKWLARWRVIALFVPLAIVVVLVWTNDNHGLIWSRTGTSITNGLVFFDRDYGPVFYIWMTYFYICTVSGSVLLLRVVIRSHALYQLQGFLIVVSTLIPTLCSILTVLDFTPVRDLDLVPYGVALSCVPLAISIFRYRLLDVVPTAHREVLYSLRDGVIICDHACRIVDMNPAAERVVWLQTPNALGKPLVSILPQMQPLCDAMAQGKTVDSEFEINDLDGTHIYEVAAHRLKHAEFVQPGIAYILRDVTHRRTTEQRDAELAFEHEKVRLLSDFIKATSHDFRTPLSALKLTSQILQRVTGQARTALVHEDAAYPPELIENFAKIEERVRTVDELSEQLSHLVNGMLQLVELENEPTFEFVKGDLNLLVAEQVKTITKRVERKNQTITMELEADLPRVRFDSWQLGHAITALLDNAHRYTPEGGTIKVCTARQWDKVIVRIEDTGIGIGATELPHVFERFYRADPARSVSAGAGLGLPIARTVAEAHGGSVEVQSEPKKGSTFTLILPIIP